jgi:3-oxoacyl-[acyl-carrier-protein] synthase II
MSEAKRRRHRPRCHHPLGGTVAETWDGDPRGRSGAKHARPGLGRPVRAAGDLRRTIAQDPTRCSTKVADPPAGPERQYALIASREAMEDAGAPEIDPSGSAWRSARASAGCLDPARPVGQPAREGPRRVFPLSVPMLMPNAASAATSPCDLGARAGAHTSVSACASGAESMGTGYDMIRAGRADMVVAGGTECAMHPICFAGFARRCRRSRPQRRPRDGASRPYDTGRDGFVMGEGAASWSWSPKSTQGPRRADLRRVRRRRRQRRRLPHHRPGAGGCSGPRAPCGRGGRGGGRLARATSPTSTRTRRATPVGDVAEYQRHPSARSATASARSRSARPSR